MKKKGIVRNRFIVKNRGPFYIYTILYGLFYIVGSLLGYARTGSVVCLSASLPLGLLILLLGGGHAIDCRRNIAIEPVYLLLPSIISLVVAILMTIFYHIGANLVPFGIVAIVVSII